MLESKIDPVLQEDLEIIANSNVPYNNIKDSTILVTGATGLIGVQLVRAILCLNRLKNTNIKILALVRNKQKAEVVFGELLKRKELKLIVEDILNPIIIHENIDYIIHSASVTASKIMVTYPVETITTSIYGTKNILDLAVNKKVKSFIYLSSMEMYGSFSQTDHMISENDLGYIDPLNLRSNYPESKRLCENMCIAYFHEYNVPIKIARLSQTFGAGILPEENRIFAQFAKSVINSEDIILHTMGLSEGNYTYLRDTIIALFIILIKGKDGEAYNVSNENSHITITEMANMVAKDIALNKIKVIYDIPKKNIYGYAAPTKMKLSSKKLKNLGWEPQVGLKESYLRLIRSMSAFKQ